MPHPVSLPEPQERRSPLLAPAPTAARRVVRDRVPHELSRLSHARRQARRDLESLAARLDLEHGELCEDRLHDLDDVVFLADVEGLILQEHLAAESALAKAVLDVVAFFGERRARVLREVGDLVLRYLTPPTGQWVHRVDELGPGDFVHPDAGPPARLITSSTPGPWADAFSEATGLGWFAAKAETRGEG
ncbi:MAG: hypothetical protein O2816_01735 [Planctomycetota bacterium]|nr:hypothetical protein [Planctomycetota bacterium]